MTEAERAALEHWQTAQASEADRKIHCLAMTLDDLTSLAHTRNGAHVLRANQTILKESLRTLHDLYIDLTTVRAA